MKTQQKIYLELGNYSFTATIVLLAAITLISGVDYLYVLKELFYFVFNQNIVEPQKFTFSTIYTDIAGYLLTTFAVVYILGLFKSKSSTKSFDIQSLVLFFDLGEGTVLKLLIAEEIFARGIFMWLLPIWLKGPTWFYILFVVGNLAWAALHLINYKDKKERNLSAILPQIVAGVTFSLIFVKYGFIASTIAHILYDAIIFTSFKEKKPSSATLKAAAIGLALAIPAIIVAYLRGIDTLKVANGELASFTFWDCYISSLIVSLGGFLISTLLNFDDYDLNNEQAEILKNNSLKAIFVSYLVTTVSVIAFANIGQSASVKIADILTPAAPRIAIALVDWTNIGIVLAMAWCVFIYSTTSGSSFARLILVSTFVTFVDMSVAIHLPFWQTALCFALVTLSTMLQHNWLIKSALKQNSF